jgi:hypothetical protein
MTSPNSKFAPKFSIVFLGNGRCYHTVDWFRSVQRLQLQKPPIFVTDLLEGEGFERLLEEESDVDIRKLLILDPYLFRSQSSKADKWRNLLKLLLLPVQSVLLRSILRGTPNPVIHAHSMHYIAMARLAGYHYVATPQGSELLKRPIRSRLYRLFARFALAGADEITVDSSAMQSVAHSLFNLHSRNVQNGIDVNSLAKFATGPFSEQRNLVLSPRGLTENYRICEILAARNEQSPKQPLVFCYPFSDEIYKKRVNSGLNERDRDLGRLSRAELHELLSKTVLVLSIPSSDSSPRSVYEAIFAGCAIAVTYSSWLDAVPACMRARIIEIQLDSPFWFQDAIQRSKFICQNPYVPSQEALIQFDQLNSARLLVDEVYPEVARKIAG